MSVLIPRLWPFLSHTTSSVRRSTLQTLKILTEINSTSNGPEELSPMKEESNGNSLKLNKCDLVNALNPEYKNLELNFGVKDWPPQLLQEALRHIYQRVLVEHIIDIQSIVETVWVNLVINAELSALLHAACPYVASWMCLAMQPSRLSFDPASMIFSKLNRVPFF